MSSTNWLKDVGYGAVASMFLGVASMLLREAESTLGALWLVEEGLDAEIMTDVPLAREEGC